MVGRAGVVEAVGRAVLRQLVAEIDLDAEQVAKGVLVLDPVQAAQDHAPLGGPCGSLGSGHAAIKPIRQGSHFAGWRAGLLLGRHLARL